MMLRTMISDLRFAIGQTVKIQGWLQTLRDQKKMQFLVLRDTTGAVQVVHEKAANPTLAGRISKLGEESAMTVTGTVSDSPKVRLGGLEVRLETLEVEAAAEAPLPLDPFAGTLPSSDFRLDWRYLDLRRPENLLVFRAANLAEMAMRQYWLQQRFIELHTPKLMGSPSESGAELFELPYFNTRAYLAQSPQFYKQMAMAAGFERVFEIGPAFRADPSFTSRHMTEFTSVDMEMSWIDSHEDVMAFMERWLHHVYTQVAETLGEEIFTLLGIEVIPPALPFPRLAMSEAREILRGLGHSLPSEKSDIDPAGERLLGRYIREKHRHDYVFLTDWPAAARPFYHMCCPEDASLTRSFDLIAKGLEVATGAQREHRWEALRRQALEKDLGLEPISFYLDFFRFGCPPHGGFGFGLARFLMTLLEIENIRETVFLFRSPTRLHP